MAKKNKPIKKATASRSVKETKRTAAKKKGRADTKTAAKPKARTAAKKQPTKAAKAKEGGGEVSFSLESRVRRHKDVAWRIIDGEAVIVTPSDSVMHTLNDVGTRIWELLTGEKTLGQVARLLCADFEVDLARSQEDTRWFVQCLHKKGLVEAVV